MLHIFSFQSGKVLIQFLIIVLSVPVTKRHPDSKIQNTVNIRFDTIVQQPCDVFFRIVDKGQNGRPSRRSSESPPLSRSSGLPPFDLLCRREVPVFYPQIIIKSRQRHLYHTFCLFVDTTLAGQDLSISRSDFVCIASPNP